MALPLPHVHPDSHSWHGREGAVLFLEHRVRTDSQWATWDGAPSRDTACRRPLSTAAGSRNEATALRVPLPTASLPRPRVPDRRAKGDTGEGVGSAHHVASALTRQRSQSPQLLPGAAQKEKGDREKTPFKRASPWTSPWTQVSLVLSWGLALDLAHFEHITSAREQSLGGNRCWGIKTSPSGSGTQTAETGVKPTDQSQSPRSHCGTWLPPVKGYRDHLLCVCEDPETQHSLCHPSPGKRLLHIFET